MPLLPLYLALPLALLYPRATAGRPAVLLLDRAQGGARVFRHLHTPGSVSDTTPSGSEGPGTPAD